jgi:peptidoglycan/xylan/chitin deacetylase (PgdA/CDA1 family)
VSPPLFGRRQLIVGGGTFLAGMAAVAVWTSADPPRPSSQPNAAGAGTSSSAVADTSSTNSTPASTSTSATSIATASPDTVPPGTAAPTSTTSAPAPGAAAVYVNHGPADSNAVALTFHLSGSATSVATLLDVLKTDGIRSTLFAVGDWLTANPDLGHRAVDEGHELANHSKSHQSMLQLGPTQVYDEIVGGGQALIPFIGSIGKWFRPSGTDVPNDIILQQAGLAGYAVSVGYDIDSLDNTNPGSKAIVNKVGAELHAGAIISLHFGHQGTIGAMPGIVDLLNTAALAPVTVSQLLGR